MTQKQGVVLTAIVILVIGVSETFINHKQPLANEPAISQGQERNKNTWNRHMIDSCSATLKTGDLVVRTGIEVTSYILSQMNVRNKTYSHCGLVVIEGGKPYVYHSIGGEDNPDACLRRDNAATFFSPLNNFGFGIARYNMADSTIQKLVAKVHQFYKEKRKFDMDFDLKTDDRLYCAEFVYKALIQATDDSNYIRPVTMFGNTYVGVDNLFMNGHAHMICEVKFK
jgi:hypothetical protein